MNEKINRMEFLKSLGFKGASLLAVYCSVPALSSCINESMDSVPLVIDFALDLGDPTFSKLNTVGNYVVQNGIVIARVSTTEFAAVTQVCSHEGKRKVNFTSGEFYCPEHGARFDTDGKGLNSKGSKGLKSYKTELTGTSLRVFS
ncbi:MAG: Rieske 2Fe-2S domain-containing protein [Algoriphagus sp.]|nr:Rieske 2Fe-2S domain-containing protein [Algoriphagus sp.]